MRIIFIGPQGSGKGTQAKIISKKLGIPHISMGDVLRNYKGVHKKEIDETMKSGKLIPDKLNAEFVRERLNQKDCEKGFILEGYPRDMQQVKDLKKITKIDRVIEISISDEEAIKRISSRSSCKPCGAVYNDLFNPEKKKGICDNCGGKLYKREDDVPKAVKKRLDIYHNETEPILKVYDSIKVEGNQSIDKVMKDILEKLGKN